MVTKVLIANRGEIAIRIIRACKELAIKTVAIYSEADVNAMHVPLADESVCVGPPESGKSYLNIPNILSAAEITGCNAIHPGYGFLAENSLFAETCERCNITFIGPSPATIAMMGNKAIAKKAMDDAGIPTIPGSDGKVETAERALDIAKKIKYPVIIKSSSGGGGRGMRVVWSDVELISSFNLVQSEALSSFGNADIYVEKYIEKPRHIEFQILCDGEGNRVHLGERECSIQRRYQKLIEETPSTAITDDVRKKMGEVSLKIAKVANYVSAGTVEYLMDRDGNFYFIEVNTRIQVEHPITEMVTGIDLIKEQIRIASGETLNVKQEDITFTGHSIECRINAEDPDKFMPCSGIISSLHLPGGPGVRIDTAIRDKHMVLPYYDSLLAKLIVHGKDRKDAIGKMQGALEEFHISGIKTTIPFHKKVFKDKDFRAGNYCTDFINRYKKSS